MRARQRGRSIHTLEPLEWRRLFTVISVNPQPIALQVPQLNAILRRTPTGTPLGDPVSEIDPVFDTASPGLLINSDLSDGLGVNRLQAGGGDAVFTHDHSQGSINNNISEQLYYGLADPANFGSYINGANPKYLEIGAPPGNDALADQSVFGPEAVAGQVVVIDPTPANNFGDPMDTYVYPPNTPFTGNIGDPGIPTVSHHVKLSYGDYTRFTTNVSGAANVPNLHKLVFVGNNPIEPDPTSPQVGFGYNGSNGTGAFLLATGASTSMISLAKAASLGVTYQAGTFNTASAALAGVPASQQFRITVQSAAGPVTLAGFYLSTLTLQTTEGDPLIFQNAPVLVGDVSLGALASPNHVVLDGVLGMNLFAASAKPLSATTIDQQTDNAFNWIVYDEAGMTLGLDSESVGSHPRVLSATFNYQGTGAPSVTVQYNSNTDSATTDPAYFRLADQATDTKINTPVQVDYNSSTHVATYTFTGFPQGLPDANYKFTLFDGVVSQDSDGASLGRDFTMSFFSYQGDANHDRTINALDLNAVATNFGMANKGFAGGDFNYDGVTNTADFTLLAGRFNQTLAGPDAPSPILAPAGEIAPPSGAAAPAPLPQGLFSQQPVGDLRMSDNLAAEVGL